MLITADDLELFKTITSQTDRILLERDLINIQIWLKSIGLSFHPDRCFTYITKNVNKISYTYKIHNTDIKEIEFYRDLGILFTPTLFWDNHIITELTKISCKVGVIIRYCNPITDIDAITTLQKSLVRSTVDYGSVIWNPKTIKDKKYIEDIQSRFVRYLFQNAIGFIQLTLIICHMPCYLRTFLLKNLKQQLLTINLHF